MQCAIDGSNVLLNLIVDGKPSTRLFAKLLLTLKERGFEFKLFFDKSIPHLMREKGVSPDWKALESALATAGIKPQFAPRADTPIEEFCAANNAALINAHDKIDSWSRKPKTIYRARVGRSKNSIQIELRDSRGQFVLTAPANNGFNFGGLDFPALDPVRVGLGKKLFSGEHDPVGVTEAVMLVFALDASKSMEENNTFDGQSKKKHLNDIMIKVFKRLRASRIGDRLYIAILRFSDDVVTMNCPNTDGAGFLSVDAWNGASAGFDYMAGMTSGNTNIRLAFQRSKELIQDMLFDKEEADRIADSWRATIILITDGKHVVRKEDGTLESARDVIDELIDIDSGAAELIGGKIDVGCVGIGNDVNIDLLSKVASPCSPKQLQMAKTNQIASHLVGGSLFVNVDSKDVKYEEVIRSFIDIASGSA